MNIYLTIAILLANVLAVAIVYQFIKKLEKKEKIIFIAVSIALMYCLISITYWISGFGVDTTVHEASKNLVLYLFVPVNVILFIPYFAFQYMKMKSKHIKAEKFINKLATLIILLIIVLIFEYFYFKDIQTNIKNVYDKQNENLNTQIETNEITNELNTDKIVNELNTNEMANELNTNKIKNSNIIENTNIIEE